MSSLDHKEQIKGPIGEYEDLALADIHNLVEMACQITELGAEGCIGNSVSMGELGVPSA